jgi:hypothetical protein
MKKEQFVYSLKSNLGHYAYFTSLKKANQYKEYLEENYSLKLIKDHKNELYNFNNSEYQENNFIKIEKTPLNIY